MSKDRTTKFRINTFSSRKRLYVQGPKKIYTNIKERCYPQFLEAKKNGKKMNFTSDKLAHYKKGFHQYVHNVATLTHGVPIGCKKYGRKRNNNGIERDHQYSRALEKTSRGHKNLDGISALLDIGDAYSNYIDKQKTGREKIRHSPAQRARINVNLREHHQLLQLIKKAYAED